MKTNKWNSLGYFSDNYGLAVELFIKQLPNGLNKYKQVRVTRTLIYGLASQLHDSRAIHTTTTPKGST